MNTNKHNNIDNTGLYEQGGYDPLADELRDTGFNDGFFKEQSPRPDLDFKDIEEKWQHTLSSL